MNKSELIERIAYKTGASHTTVRAVLDEFVSAIADAIDDPEGLHINGFGRFVWITTKERKARNLHTGETVIVPPHKRLSFRPAKRMRDLGKQ